MFNFESFIFVAFFHTFAYIRSIFLRDFVPVSPTFHVLLPIVIRGSTKPPYFLTTVLTGKFHSFGTQFNESVAFLETWLCSTLLSISSSSR